jgi:hypothetical protein
MPGLTRTLDLNAHIGVWQFDSATPDDDLATGVVELWEVHGTLRGSSRLDIARASFSVWATRGRSCSLSR